MIFQTGARVLAIVEVVCIGLVLLSDLIRLTAFDGSTISFTLNVIWVAFFCAVIALLFQAIKTENSILALPHLIYQVRMFQVLTISVIQHQLYVISLGYQHNFLHSTTVLCHFRSGHRQYLGHGGGWAEYRQFFLLPRQHGKIAMRQTEWIYRSATEL